MRSRGWLLTVWDCSEERIEATKNLLAKDPKVRFCLMGQEVSPTTGKDHLQGWIYFENAVTRGGLNRRLGFESGVCHSEAQRGTVEQCIAYCSKEGSIVIEYGEVPTIDNLKESAWDYILEMIDMGHSNLEIMRRYPAEFARCRGAIDSMKMESTLAQLNEWREVKVNYIWGKTGSGKTRGVLDSVEDRTDVYRITDYKHPFDSYRGQSIIMFEEFRSSISLEKMLIYLDGYVCELPSRYNNKASAYDTVYIVTNIPLQDQYCNVQNNHPESYAALLRRIDSVEERN